MNTAEFALAVLNPDLTIPAGLVDAKGRPAGCRFDVYRNTVVSGLTEVLEAGFPVVRKLVGDQFFAAMAAEFLRHNPPRSRLMMLYGDAFPGFLQAFPPVAHLGYLPDVAKLELTLRQSYHAADRQSVPAERLAAIAPSRYSQISLLLAPSVFALTSDWPVLSIWRSNTDPADGQPPMGREDVLVMRPGFDPQAHQLAPGGAQFVQALQSGMLLARAIEDCGMAPDALSDLISLLVEGGAISDILGDVN